MESIRVEYHDVNAYNAQDARSTVGRSFDVLAEHKDAFQRELNALNTMHDLVEKFETAPWWIRTFFAAGAVFDAQYYAVRRNKTRGGSFASAFRVTLVFCAPERLSLWLWKRWATPPPAAPATSDPE